MAPDDTSDARRRSPVVIIGAGVAGLFAACRLARLGLRPVVLDAAPRIGGLLAWERFGDADLELFYHHAFIDDAFLLDALASLGVGVGWTVTRTGFVGPRRPGISELSAPQHLLTFSYLPAAMRVRMASVLARTALAWRRRGVLAPELDRLSAEEWMCRWGGRPAWEGFFRPLLEKKFGARTPDISAAFMTGRLGMRSGRTSRGEKLGYPSGGFRSLVEGLAARITELGGEIRTRQHVRGLRVEGGRVVGVRTDDAELDARAVVATASPGSLSRVLGASDLAAEAAVMDRLPYQKALTVLLGLTRPTSDFYWLNIMHRDSPYGALIDHSNLVPPEPYGGPIVYLAAYPDPDSPLWGQTDEEVVATCLAHLHRQLPGTATNPVRWSRVIRADEASLVYVRGVRDLLPPRRAASVGGLYYTGMFRCYPLRKIDLVGAEACATADIVAHDLRGGAPSWEPAALPTRLDP